MGRLQRENVDHLVQLENYEVRVFYTSPQPAWRSMDSAPKVKFYCDPSDSVVAAVFNGDYLQCWKKARFVDDQEEDLYGWYSGNTPLDFQPTHWIPLPEAPKE